MKLFWLFVNLISVFGLTRYAFDLRKEHLDRFVAIDHAIEPHISAAALADTQAYLSLVKQFCGFVAIFYFVFFYLVIALDKSSANLVSWLSSIYLFFSFIWFSIYAFQNIEKLVSHFVNNLLLPTLFLFAIPLMELLGAKTGLVELMYLPIARIGAIFGWILDITNPFYQTTIVVAFLVFAEAILLVLVFLYCSLGYLFAKSLAVGARATLRLVFKVWRQDRALTPIFALLLVISAYQLI